MRLQVGDSAGTERGLIHDERRLRTLTSFPILYGTERKHKLRSILRRALNESPYPQCRAVSYTTARNSPRKLARAISPSVRFLSTYG